MLFQVKIILNKNHPQSRNTILELKNWSVSEDFQGVFFILLLFKNSFTKSDESLEFWSVFSQH